MTASLESALANKVTGRTIATYQHIALGIACNPATDPGRIAPDYLGIMPDILPTTRGTHIGKDTVGKKLFFVNPAVDHLAKSKGAGGSGP